MAAMTTADAIDWLRSGLLEENILVQITHQPMVEDKAIYGCDLGSYTDQPIICANDGVLRVAQRDFQGTDGRYYGVITRLTGLGDVFSGLLSGGPRKGAGTLEIVLDGSAVMDEAKALDWDYQAIEVRTGPPGTEWADALPLFLGLVADAQLKNKGSAMAFRLTGLEERLGEVFRPEDTTNLRTTWFDGMRLPMGFCPKFPVKTLGTKSGANFVYETSGWSSADDYSTLMFDGDTSDAHADYAEGRVTMTNSNGWTLGAGGVPTNYVSASVKGYDVGGDFVTQAGEILIKALSVLRTRDEDNNLVTCLDGVTVDSATFTEYDTRAIYSVGYLFDYQETGWENSALGQSLTGGFSYFPDWVSAFEHLVEGTGGLWCFNREGELGIHWLLGNPSGETEVLTLKPKDFSQADATYSEVDRYRRVEVTSSWRFSDNTVIEYDYAGVEYYEAKQRGYQTLEVNSTITNVTQMQNYADDLLARFGLRDYKLSTPLAKVLNVGDVVKLEDPDDDYVASGRKGHVIGVDRGTSPVVYLRV